MGQSQNIYQKRTHIKKGTIPEVQQCISIIRSYQKEVQHIQRYNSGLSDLKDKIQKNMQKLKHVQGFFKEMAVQTSIKKNNKCEIDYFIAHGAMIFQQFQKVFQDAKKFYRKKIIQLSQLQQKIGEFLENYESKQRKNIQKYGKQLKRYRTEKEGHIVTKSQRLIQIFKQGIDSARRLKEKSLILCHSYYMDARDMWKFNLTDLTNDISDFRVDNDKILLMAQKAGGNLKGVRFKWDPKFQQKAQTQSSFKKNQYTKSYQSDKKTLTHSFKTHKPQNYKQKTKQLSQKPQQEQLRLSQIIRNL